MPHLERRIPRVFTVAGAAFAILFSVIVGLSFMAALYYSIFSGDVTGSFNNLVMAILIPPCLGLPMGICVGLMVSALLLCSAHATVSLPNAAASIFFGDSWIQLRNLLLSNLLNRLNLRNSDIESAVEGISRTVDFPPVVEVRQEGTTHERVLRLLHTVIHPEQFHVEDLVPAPAVELFAIIRDPVRTIARIGAAPTPAAPAA